MSETNNKDFCGVYREYYDKDKTKIKSEVFMMNGKKKVYINHIIKMGN